MQIKVIRVHRHTLILELDDDLDAIALGARREVQEWMFVQTKLCGNAVETGICAIVHSRIVKIIAGGTGILYISINGDHMTETTYTSLRQSLASVLDRVVNDREVVIVRRKGDKKVAMVPADELAGLMETAHLLRSPKNAKRLLNALRRATSRKGKAESLNKLRQELQLGSR